VPNLSYESGSQANRFQVIRRISQPDALAARFSDDDLKRSIEGSIAQASVMWLLHRGLEVVQDRRESLEQQIVQFSSAVFEALLTSYPVLRYAGNERLWFIYFKGFLNANTHPREEMVSALRNIASENGFGDLRPLFKKPGETEKPTRGRTSDAEALEQIARGLEPVDDSFEI
jgi:hypothetical protein